MRRFFAFPSFVVFGAIGFSGPKPFVVMRASSTPFATNHAFTDSAHQSGLDYFKAWYAGEPARQFRTSADVVAEWQPDRVHLGPRRDPADLYGWQRRTEPAAPHERVVC